jgi:hypothetical protein
MVSFVSARFQRCQSDSFFLDVVSLIERMIDSALNGIMMMKLKRREILLILLWPLVAMMFL